MNTFGMECFEYPLDTQMLLRKKRAIRRQLLAENPHPLHKKIAILGGSTTNEVADQLGLFLLQYGIEAEFYQSEFGQYWQDAMFGNETLDAFAPDLVFVHTGWRNITQFPAMGDTPAQVQEKLDAQLAHFTQMWQAIETRYHCPIIQNNFDRPNYRLMGNRDIWDIHGRSNFVARLNLEFARCAAQTQGLYLNDIDYLAADFGLSAWGKAFYWHMYKYALSLDAIPGLAASVAAIVKSIYGRNKKALVLDLDNTLWGGVVGDDGVEGIAVGPEIPSGQVYAEFQSYCKALKSIGVILAVDSKNDEENALAGLRHPDGVLRPEDFVSIKANWEDKASNLAAIAAELNLGVDSFVFVDDNPAERSIVAAQLPGVAVPAMDKVEESIQRLDHGGYFEVTTLSGEDLAKTELYQANARRQQAVAAFADYEEYLQSLEMRATIRNFEPIYIQRIAQLTNKSNQFNLTTLRCTEEEIRAMAADDAHLCLYGKLEDKFGDNGVVSVVIGKQQGDALYIRLWLMSCRVLKRGMEQAMMNTLMADAAARGIKTVYGVYYPTAKNHMVEDFYPQMGFEAATYAELEGEGKAEAEGTAWRQSVSEYRQKTVAIEILR